MTRPLTESEKEAAFPAEERARLASCPLADLAVVYEAGTNRLRQLHAELRHCKLRDHEIYGIFRDRLGAEVPYDKGLEVRRIVYRASKDRRGLDRIEIVDQPEGGGS